LNLNVDLYVRSVKLAPGGHWQQNVLATVLLSILPTNPPTSDLRGVGAARARAAKERAKMVFINIIASNVKG
jgi:hypothetical protein